MDLTLSRGQEARFFCCCPARCDTISNDLACCTLIFLTFSSVKIMPVSEILIVATPEIASALAAILRDRYACVLFVATEATETAAETAKALGEKSFPYCIPALTDAAELKKLIDIFPDTIFFPLTLEDKRRQYRDLLAVGAFAVLLPPFDKNKVTDILDRAETFLRRKNDAHEIGKGGPRLQFYGIIGDSPAMRRLFELLVRIAEDDLATVLIRGESGTGKEMVARAIHAGSPRAGRNFVPVNCAAIPDELLESELFGYAKGAFTGATANKTGRIQYADGGTLFLDEIGDMKFPLQAKLLRVLQEKEFEPVGAVKSVPVDVRVLAATHCDLERLVKEGKFREDLYYRLSVIPVQIPPLKDRRHDIPLLIDAFIDNFTIRRQRPSLRFTPQALQSLCQCEWRGNVRELENLVQYMSVLHSGQEVDFADLPEQFQKPGDAGSKAVHPEDLAASPMELPVEPLMEAQTEAQTKVRAKRVATPAALARAERGILFADLDGCFSDNSGLDFNRLIGEMENRLIRHALRLAEGNKKEAARILHLKRTTLLEKMKKKSELFADL